MTSDMLKAKPSELRTIRAAGASLAAIAHHYDVSDDFYRLWLDETLTYSCAMWLDGGTDAGVAEGDTLEAAQLRKLDYHAAVSEARGAARVLDVGCGWGGLLRRLVEVHDVGRAVGLTLSAGQARFIASLNDPRVEVHVSGWADHVAAPGAYDAIVSVGAMEHFCQAGLGARARVAQYRAFFASCREWLRPGGRLSLQTIARGTAQLDRQGLIDTLFIAREIFPESVLPSQDEVTAAAKGLFEVFSVRHDRAHYARTCAEWRRRLARHQDAAARVAPPAVVQRYDRYLQAVIRQFELGQAELLRIGLRRD